MNEFKFKKKYGQNFLKNPKIIDAIVSSINPTEKDLIIEIGPGSGAITKHLKKYCSKLIAFEIDTDTEKYLTPLKDERTEIIYKDFLKVELNELLNNIEYEKLYFIGNLPYYITTPIIEKIIDSKLNIESITIMVQKEVADRFLAKPRNKEYGYMTLLLNYWYNIKRVVNVTKADFVPMPKVDSAVVQLIRKNNEEIDYIKFKKLLKDSFQFKRKTLNNNLNGYNKIKIEKVLNKHNYSLKNRAEEIDLDTFIDITKSI